MKKCLILIVKSMVAELRIMNPIRILNICIDGLLAVITSN